MSTPMIDLPEHLPIHVNFLGEGPVPEEEADRIECWCGKDGCQEFLRVGGV